MNQKQNETWEESQEEKDKSEHFDSYVSRSGTGMHFFKGYSFNVHASAEVNKGERILIWILTLGGILTGVSLALAHHPVAGIFAAIVMISAGLLGVGFKAILRNQNPEDTKTLLMTASIFLVVFLFLGVIFAIVF